MSKTLTIIFIAFTLGGCIPLPISLGVSGWSYLISGKSPTDHLISQTINQDCKILRLAVGKEPCAAFTNGERSLVWAVLRGDRERPAVTLGAFLAFRSFDFMDCCTCNAPSDVNLAVSPSTPS